MSRSPRDGRAQRRLGLPLAAAVLAITGLVALSSPQRDAGAEGGLSVVMTDGHLAHDNSLDGSAILSASEVWPGWTGSGDVTITNSGTSGSWLRLTEAAIDDVPGPGGGELSDRLALLVEDVTIPAFPVPVYTGTLGGVGERWLGRMEPGTMRTYRFRTSMPDGTGDNAFQSSAVTVRFEWAVSDIDPDAPPIDPPPVEPPVDPPPVDPPVDAPVEPPVEPPPVDPPVEPPPVDPPVEPPPVDPPAEPPVDVVPDGPPIVEVTRKRLNVRLAIPVTQRPLQTRKLVAFASCSRRCRATFSGKLGSSSRSSARRVRRMTRRLPAGIRVKVRLRMSRKTVSAALRALRRGRSVRGAVKMVARDRSGRVVRAKQRIRLVPARR